MQAHMGTAIQIRADDAFLRLIDEAISAIQEDPDLLPPTRDRGRLGRALLLREGATKFAREILAKAEKKQR